MANYSHRVQVGGVDKYNENKLQPASLLVVNIKKTQEQFLLVFFLKLFTAIIHSLTLSLSFALSFSRPLNAFSLRPSLSLSYLLSLYLSFSVLLKPFRPPVLFLSVDHCSLSETFHNRSPTELQVSCFYLAMVQVLLPSIDLKLTVRWFESHYLNKHFLQTCR